jgi:hypothetical protein
MLSWKCHVCGKERPDSLISVYRKKSLVNDMDIQQNIRYCNDKPECTVGARKVDFLKPKPEKKEPQKRPPRRKIVKRK